jgi:putative transposase
MIAQAQQEHVALSVTDLCHVVGVGRSWFYQRPRVPTLSERDLDLRDAIERIVLAFPGYGYRRVTKALERDGWAVNHKRVLRVMRQASLLCQLQRHFVVTTASRHDRAVYPNLLAETMLTGLNQAWQADITYVRLPTAFVYLAAILDAFSRKIIGWALSREIDTRLTRAALEMALDRRSPTPGFIHHADRGVQYASADYVARLVAAGARISMSAKGTPYDNAKAESFFKTLKHEEVYLKRYASFADAEANLGQFIDDIYNVKRLHSSLGYVPPAEFEAQITSTEPKLTLNFVR